jgi:hypothetical protein
MSRFGMTDLAILLLAGAALPGLGAALGVVAGQGVRPPYPGRFASVVVGVNLLLGLIAGAVDLSPGGLLVTTPIAVLLAVYAGRRIARWDWVIAAPLAFAGGWLGWVAVRLQLHGIAPEWQQLTRGADFLEPSTFADLLIVGMVSLFAILPAGVIATVVKRRRNRNRWPDEATTGYSVDQFEVNWAAPRPAGLATFDGRLPGSTVDDADPGKMR